MNKHKIIVKIEFYDAKDLEVIHEISELEWNLSRPELRPYLMIDGLVKIVNSVIEKLYPECDERAITINKEGAIFELMGDNK